MDQSQRGDERMTSCKRLKGLKKGSDGCVSVQWDEEQMYACQQSKITKLSERKIESFVFKDKKKIHHLGPQELLIKPSSVFVSYNFHTISQRASSKDILDVLYIDSHYFDFFSHSCLDNEKL